MAADAASIGAEFSSYRGDPNLGGAGLGVFQIDTRQLANLAAYSFSYNSALYAQKQKALEAEAKEAAEFAEYDLTNAIPKYAKVVRDKYDEIFKWAQENPDVKSYSKNPRGYEEWKKKLNGLKNDILDGASQEIINTAFQNAINKETRPEVIASLEKQRKEQIEANDIHTPIKFQQYDAEPTIYPDVPKIKFNVLKKDANGDMIYDTTYEVADQHFIAAQAAVIGTGLDKEMFDENSAAFKALPPDLQKLKLAARERGKATGRNDIVDQARVATDALKQFTDPTTGKIDIEKVKASNKITSGLISNIDAYNLQMDDELAKRKAGMFKDNKGWDEKDYDHIDYTDGEITTTDLALLNLRAKAPAVSYKVDAKELDNTIKRGNLAVEWYKAKTGRITANKKEGSDKPLDVIDKPAILFGQHIDRLKKYFLKKGAGDYKVDFKGVDETTKNALGLKEGESVIYRPDGTYIVIGKNVGGKSIQRIVGTIEELAQGFINAVKTIDLAGSKDKDGTMAEGFQIKSENKFKEIFGTSSGKQIWDNWGDTKQVEAIDTPTQLSGEVDVSTLETGKTYEVSGKTYIWNGSKLKPQ